MTSSENPWVEVLSQPKYKTTEGIVPYFIEQISKLTEASDGKVNGFFPRLLTLTDCFLLLQNLLTRCPRRF